MKLHPLPKWIYVREIAPPTELHGIHIPDTAQDPPCRGLVLDCGDDIPPQVLAGCVVFWGAYAGHEIPETYDLGADLRLVRYEDLIAIAKLDPGEDPLADAEIAGGTSLD